MDVFFAITDHHFVHKCCWSKINVWFACALDMNILIKLKNKNQSKADKLLHVAFMSVCVAVNATYGPSIKHSIK